MSSAEHTNNVSESDSDDSSDVSRKRRRSSRLITKTILDEALQTLGRNSIKVSIEDITNYIALNYPDIRLDYKAHHMIEYYIDGLRATGAISYVSKHHFKFSG
ncbi:uncharacterized protein LOC119662286 [Teleopsis dalmanni]|uniref:uncharacterized protein LOC119662286 n=1 Tax=Teleopsis dalmanni TaxID=139649 RepID=UPI0018CFB05A|nr:uncharacterized protein LOC119662286 [Teleopsis dalmanni]